MSNYSRASMDDSSESEAFVHEKYSSPVRSHPLRSRLVAYAWRTATVCLALLGVFSLFPQVLQRINPPKEVSCSCGNSIAEAESLDCRYDPIAAAWLPPACRDDELTEAFNHAGPAPDGSWYYYTDWDKTDTLNLTQVAGLAANRGHFFSTHEWHIAHCTWTWRKQVRAAETGITIEKRARGVGHVGHCEMMFKKRDALDDVVTGSGVSLNADLIPVPHKHREDFM